MGSWSTLRLREPIVFDEVMLWAAFLWFVEKNGYFACDFERLMFEM